MIRDKIGILGGTFDPIHIGHLRLALELKQALNFAQMYLMPCHRPVHREQPQVSSAARAEMIRQALIECPELRLDERELHRDRPSYTIDTLCSVRAELGPDVSLVWVMGTDAFAALDTWNRWQELLDYAHLAVIERPGFGLPQAGPVADLLATRGASIAALDELSSGTIVLPSLRLLDISATDVRAQIACGKSPQFLVPEVVRQYIQSHGLYQ